jgi:hypothetical protein
VSHFVGFGEWSMGFVWDDGDVVGMSAPFIREGWKSDEDRMSTCRGKTKQRGKNLVSCFIVILNLN